MVNCGEGDDMPAPFITLLGSIARTATGVGDAIDLTQFDPNIKDGAPPMLRVQSDVTAVSGTTPSLTMLIQDSVDGGVNWNTIGTFTAQTAVNRQVIQIAISGVAQSAGFAWPFNYRKIRCSWTISGTTPSITSSVKCVIL